MKFVNDRKILHTCWDEGELVLWSEVLEHGVAVQWMLTDQRNGMAEIVQKQT